MRERKRFAQAIPFGQAKTEWVTKLNSVIQFLVINASSTQFFLFATALISMWLIESTARVESKAVKFRHTAVNALFMSGALPVQGCLMLFCLGLASWATKHNVGLVHLLSHANDPWIKYGVMFFVLDGLDYLYHVLMHRVPAFWRFHRLHHTDRFVDVSTTFREHPAETGIRNVFLILCVLLSGASIEVLILRQTVETVSNIFSHTSLSLRPWPARLLGSLFITPNLHHAHHHFQMPATNCNYGDVFSIWDRLFGTFTTMTREEIVFGLDTHMGIGKSPTTRL